ncbi:MAG: hypothetical protein D6677_05500 [Calditrichaeota bacterium]|nr:MAG: hypothetical protein D6677_05500 [Calditrichota bacterium]
MNDTNDVLLSIGQTLFDHAYTIMLYWLIAMFVLFVALLLRYTFGLGFDKDNPNPHINETFAMPRGVFRGLITLTLLFLVTLVEVINLSMPFLNNGELIGKLVGEHFFFPADRNHDLMTAFQMMLAFYFGSKVMHHITSTDKQKTELMVQAMESENDFGSGDARG